MQVDRPASRTAVFVCQARALADEAWDVDGFSDPIAWSLLRDEERSQVDRARAPDAAGEWRDRAMADWIKTCAEVMVPRTVAIDDAIREATHQQVVIVGLGLDSRPYRLECLRDATVYAIDHPASLADSTDRASGISVMAGQLVRLAVDLAETDLRSALADSGHDASLPTTWVWEGVVPYLTKQQVREVVHGIADLSATGSRLVVNYQSSSLGSVLARRASHVLARLSKVDDPFADEPWLSRWRPKGMRQMLERYGFAVDRDVDLLSVARRIGSPVTRPRLAKNGRVAVVER